MVATLANEDNKGRPFWIAKVIGIDKDSIKERIVVIKVHWYHITSPNTFTRKYVPKMIM